MSYIDILKLIGAATLKDKSIVMIIEKYARDQDFIIVGGLT